MYLIYMYKEDLALNNLQWLICHKSKAKQTKPNYVNLQEIIVWCGLLVLTVSGPYVFCKPSH